MRNRVALWAFVILYGASSALAQRRIGAVYTTTDAPIDVLQAPDPVNPVPEIGSAVPIPCDSDTTTTYIPDVNLVGEIPYTLTVGDGGRPVVDIPIETFCESGSLHPGISLRYTGANERTFMGDGWALAGLHTIERVPHNWFTDSISRGVQCDSQDAFALDGERLIRIDSECADSIEWFTGQTSRVRVCRYIGADTVNGFDHFDAYYPDGTTAKFNNAYYTRYCCNRVVRIDGSQVGIEYAGKTRPTIIHYGDGRTITFDYSLTDTGKRKYSGGHYTTEPGRLTYIRVNKGEEEIATYRLDYNNSYDVNAPVTRIIRTDAQGNALKSLSFHYGARTASSDTTTLRMSKYFGNYDYGGLVTVPGKFDHKSDNDGFMVYPNRSPYFVHNMLGNMIVNQYRSDDSIIVATSMRDYVGTIYCETIPTHEDFVDAVAMDIDGIHGDEVVTVRNHVSGDSDVLVISNHYLRDLPPGINPPSSFVISKPSLGGLQGAPRPRSVIAGDFDGDGRDELAVISHSHPLGLDVKGCIDIIRVTPTSATVEGSFEIDSCRIGLPCQFPVGNNDPIEQYKTSHRIVPMDYDGDGKMELAVFTPDSMHIYAFQYNASRTLAMQHIKSNFPIAKKRFYEEFHMTPGDFNGDGITDIALHNMMVFHYGVRRDTVSQVFLGDGKGRLIPCVYTTSTDNNADEQYPAHLDNDRITDRLTYNHETGRLHTSMRGESWVSSQIPADSHIVPCRSLARGGSVMYAIGRNGRVTAVRIDRTTDERCLLTSMRDCMGNEHEFRYRRLCYGYSVESSFKLFDYVDDYSLQGNGRAVLSQHLHTAGGTTLHNVGYSFEYPVMNLRGLGFCGFERISWQDSITGLHGLTVFRPDSFGIPVYKRDIRYNRTLRHTARRELGGRITIRLVCDSIHDKATGTDAVNTYSYTTHGDLAGKLTEHSDGSTQEHQLTFTDITGGTHRKFSLPVHETWSTGSGGVSALKGKLTFYNSKNLPDSVIEYSGAPANVLATHTYTYDSMGRTVIHSVRQYTASTAMTEQFEYDYGRTPSAATDFTGARTSFRLGAFGFDHWFRHINTPVGGGELTPAGANDGGTRGGGLVEPLPDLDPLGLMTRYHYDSFGRVDSISTPYGSGIRFTRSWAAPNDAGAALLVETTEDGRPALRDWYDPLGHHVRHSEQRFDGSWLTVDSVFDSRGRLVQASAPYKSHAALWTVYTYDNYDRPTSITHPDGHVDTFGYNALTDTATIDGVTIVRTRDALGRLVAVSDPGGTVAYSLRPDGQPASVTVNGEVTTTFEYDQYGRRTAITDPSAGRRETAYDAAGNVCLENDSRGTWVATAFNDKGLPVSRTTSDGLQASYTYDENWQLAAVSDNSGHASAWTYDDKLRPTTETIDGFMKTYTYNGKNIASVAYYDNMNYICSEFHHYTYGTMSEITTNSGVQLWQLTSESGRGMVTGTASGPLHTLLAYDLGGHVKSRNVRRGRPLVYSSSYDSDPYTGNMTRRSCGGLTELFTFDNLNRLTGNGTDEYDFDDLGNVTVRGGAGELDYGSTAPYATTFLTPETGSQVPLRSQHIHYNALQRPDTIAEGGVTAVFSYRADGSRATMAIDSVGGVLWQRTYRDRMEECYRLSGFNQPVRKMLWLGGTAYDAPAVLVRDDGYSPWVLHRVVRDNLGSIVVVTDSAGFVEQRLSYDAWGALRDPDTGVAYAPGAAPEPMLLGRGFTGHEHLTWCGLVNMNARLYDPALGRFLSPDPEVQQPEGTQGFNRYSYCLNNPLRYVDLDGENTYIFNENGKIERVEYNTYTNRIMVHTKESSNGLIWDRYQYYDLADPINDGFDIENGIITHLEFVPESDVFGMLNAQGAWDASRNEFILQSLGGGRFDYSYSVLQYRYKNAAFDGTHSHYLFLPEGDYMAHNFMNFGNYLWAATGYVVGFDIGTLRIGAHLNSKMNGKRDGTSNDWDSVDDQRSIIKGYYHAYRNGYRN